MIVNSEGLKNQGVEGSSPSVSIRRLQQNSFLTKTYRFESYLKHAIIEYIKWLDN